MRHRLAPFLAVTLLLLGSCGLYSSSGQDDRQGHYLINTRSLPNYVKTVPLPEDTSDLVVIKSVRLETRHLLSPFDFIYQAKPRPYHGRLYLMDFRRTRVYADRTPEHSYRWIEPLGGRPYRYLYTGKFVALRKDWQAEQDRKRAHVLKKEAEGARPASPRPLPPSSVSSPSLARGPLGGKVIQEDQNSMTEILPSGAYVFHPARELESSGYRYVKGSGWTKGN
jgi:hypothetical protein